MKNPDGSEVEQQYIITNSASTASTMLALDSSKNVTTVAALAIKGGTIVVQTHSAPGTGNLVAGDAAIWFDQTNGAGKLMVQAKTADGTLVAGSVTLS